jgi:uncharacterized membrane protein AbrB (regulator of aidB expression)
MGLLKVLFWATLGGTAAQRFHMPGGAFIGALLACGLYRILATEPASLPASVSLIVQILAGVLVGSSLDPEPGLSWVRSSTLASDFSSPTCSLQWAFLNRRQPCTA